nr:PREDICTED: odorant receptor 13a-like isoform X1 [Megachile rotundata]
MLTMTLAVLKSGVWMFNRKDLECFINFMLTGYWKIVNADVFVYLEEYAIYAKNVSRGYFISMCNALLFYSSLPIIEILISKSQVSNNNSTIKKFPFTGTSPAAFHKFPFYEMMYIFQMLATNICSLIMLATDGIIAIALLHTCGHFAVLKQKLKNLDSCIYCITNSEKNSTNIKTDLYDIKIQLMHTIQHHQIILWFCDNMEKNFHLMLFLQSMTSSILICFVGFQVSTALSEISKLFKSFAHLLVALFQLLLFCFPGDILIRQSCDISTAVFSIKWYKLPSLIKDEVYMIILRSQKPCSITAGKLYVMHLENFAAVSCIIYLVKKITFLLLQSYFSS